MNTTYEYKFPRKQEGWCEEHGVQHAWESGPTLTSSPPILTRVCVNCGKQQQLRSFWEGWEG